MTHSPHRPARRSESCGASERHPPKAAVQPLDPVRWVDTQLLRVFRGDQSLGIGEMAEALGVTATAIRQRIERLMTAGMIQRRKVIAGRGRPSFVYRLTTQGQRCASADSTQLAEAMWQEILALADGDLRSDLLLAVAKRLGRGYAQRISADAAGAGRSLGEKMQLLSGTLAAQQIDTRSGVSEGPEPGLPVLAICTCPYPVLRDVAQDRSMCQLEAEIFSEALGAPVELAQCVLDGDSSCHFVPAARPPAIPVGL